MKHFFITALLLVLIYSCTTRPQSESDAPQDETIELEQPEPMSFEEIEADSIIERRTAGRFKIVIYTPLDDNPTVTNCHIVVNDSSGRLVSELKYIRSAGHEWNSLSTELHFVDDAHFEIVRTTDEFSPGVEMDDPNGVDKEEFLRLEDPYDIVDQIIAERVKEQYEINNEGKIQLTNSTRIEYSKEIEGLDRFDVLPVERLRMLRNMIFAKLGYKFKSKDLQDFFQSKTWYEPKLDNVDELLTDSDKIIIAYLKDLESKTNESNQ